MSFSNGIHLGVEKTIHGTDKKAEVSMCSGLLFSDITDDIEEVTCSECLKLYIKSNEEKWKNRHQIDICKDVTIRNLRLHVKKLSHELNAAYEKLRLKSIA